MSADKYTQFTPDSGSKSQSDFTLKSIGLYFFCLSRIWLHLPLNRATFEVCLVCIAPIAMSADEYTQLTPDSGSESRSDFTLKSIGLNFYCLSWIRLHLRINRATFEVCLVCIEPIAMSADEYTQFTPDSGSESRSEFTLKSIGLYFYCLSWFRLHLRMNQATFEVYLVCIDGSQCQLMNTHQLHFHNVLYT